MKSCDSVDVCRRGLALEKLPRGAFAPYALMMFLCLSRVYTPVVAVLSLAMMEDFALGSGHNSDHRVGHAGYELSGENDLQRRIFDVALKDFAGIASALSRWMGYALPGAQLCAAPDRTEGPACATICR